MATVDKDLVISTCLVAGRIMIEGGSEIYRVEDTMRRIARKSSGGESEIFVTITGVLMTLDVSANTRYSEIHKRGIDMEKINRVNKLSRSFESDEISLVELRHELYDLNQNPPHYPFYQRVLAAGLESAFLMIIFTQKLALGDMPLAMFAGAVGYATSEFIGKNSRIRFVQEFLGALMLGIVSVLGVRLGLGNDINYILIGAIMPLVPGVPITNALRDLFEGNLMAGIERGFEALIVVFAIASAIGVLFQFY